MKRIALFVLVAVLAFVAGRFSAPTASEGVATPTSTPQQPAPALAVTNTTTRFVLIDGGAAAPAIITRNGSSDSRTVVMRVETPSVTTTATDCPTQLAALQAAVRTEAEQRSANEGAPLPPPAADLDPRFGEKDLKSSLSQAFTQSKVPGGVNGVDCAEYPCLLYGRIRGSEDFMERIEQTRALAAYQEDIMVALLWTVTDEAERPVLAANGLPAERAEQTLFSISLYPRSDRMKYGDVLDRRLRARTFALWNTMSPFDETGR